MKNIALEKFNQARDKWESHKVSCKQCRDSHKSCSNGSELRKNVLDSFRLAAYSEG